MNVILLMYTANACIAGYETFYVFALTIIYAEAIYEPQLVKYLRVTGTYSEAIH